MRRIYKTHTQEAQACILRSKGFISLGQWTHPETQLQVFIASALTEYWHSGWEVGHSVLGTHDMTNLLDVSALKDQMSNLV